MASRRERYVSSSLADGVPHAIDKAIQFLEADRWFHGSGYQKEELWRQMGRRRLSSGQRQRLQAVALTYVRTRSGREFRYMCRAMVRVAAPEFWRAAYELTRHQDVRVVQRAALLHSYADGCNERQRRHIAWLRGEAEPPLWIALRRWTRQSHADE